jgi:hypothetical protein
MNRAEKIIESSGNLDETKWVVVRKGKKVVVHHTLAEKPGYDRMTIDGKEVYVKRSAKKQAALAQARKHANTSAAKVSRAHSMAVRKSMGK